MTNSEEEVESQIFLVINAIFVCDAYKFSLKAIYKLAAVLSSDFMHMFQYTYTHFSQMN